MKSESKVAESRNELWKNRGLYIGGLTPETINKSEREKVKVNS